MHQVGIQRVVAGHQHHERALSAPAGSAGLLPERGDRSGKNRPAPPHPARRYRCRVPARWWWPDRATARREVPARARCGPPEDNPARYGATVSVNCGAMSSSRARVASAISSAPRRDRTKVSVRAPSATRSAIRRAASLPADRLTGAPFSPVRSVRSAGSHSATVRAPCGEPSSVTSSTGWPMSSAAVAPGADVVALAKMTVSGAARVGGVPRTQPQQSPQHHRHVRSENTSVVMTFVHYHVSKVAQEHGPAGVVAQQRQVDHVGVGEHPARALAGQPAYLACAVAVVGRWRHIGQPSYCCAQRVRGPQLVVTKGFGRRDVQRASARIGRQRSEDGELVGHRFPGRGAGTDDDVTAGVRQIRGLEPGVPTAD